MWEERFFDKGGDFVGLQPAQPVWFQAVLQSHQKGTPLASLSVWPDNFSFPFSLNACEILKLWGIIKILKPYSSDGIFFFP